MPAARSRAGRKAAAAATEQTALVDGSDEEHDREPPSAAAAFVASASAAVLILLVALLAVVLSTAALWSIASAVPTADAATDVRGAAGRQQPAATDFLHRWHRQQEQRQRRPEPSYAALHPFRRRADGADAMRRKRQLLFKKNREPGVVSLTFSLIGGTVSDFREAFRNVSGIVRETINEASRPATTTAVTGEGDQMMMAAGNTMENEIGGSTTLAPIDEKQTGSMFGSLLGRNYRGLRRLFNSELRSAIKNSPSNVRDFAVELIGSIGQSLRPSRLLTRGPAGGNSTSTAATTAT